MAQRLANRVMQMPASSTLAVKKAADELKRKGIKIIDLGVGEPDFNTPEYVKKAAYKAIEKNFTRYTETGGIPELKEAVAQKYKRAYGVSYDKEEIIISCGAKQALFNAALTLFDEGDEVLLPSPYWVTYPEQIRIASAKPVIIELSEEDGFSLQADEVEEHITAKTKAVIINSPANPTGAVIAREELQKIIGLARRADFYVIYDECYEHFIYEGEHTSAAEFGKDNIIIVNAVSKTYAMTGWRIGWALGPKEIIKAMASLQGHSTSNPTSISQLAALEALTADQSSIAEMLREYRRRREFIVEELNSIAGISCPVPQGAFYVFPSVSSFFRSEIRNSSDFARYLLEKAGIATVSGSAFGRDDHIRISYATSMEELQEGMRRLKRLLVS